MTEPTLHELLKRDRTRRKLSKHQLAEEFGVSWLTIHRWENPDLPHSARTEHHIRLWLMNPRKLRKIVKSLKIQLSNLRKGRK